VQSTKYAAVHKSQRCQVAITIKFCMVSSNACVRARTCVCVCGASVQELLHVTILEPTILRWLLHFWKFMHPSQLQHHKNQAHHMHSTFTIECHSFLIDIKSLVPCNMHMTRTRTHGIYMTYISNQNSCVPDF